MHRFCLAGHAPSGTKLHIQCHSDKTRLRVWRKLHGNLNSGHNVETFPYVAIPRLASRLARSG